MNSTEGQSPDLFQSRNFHGRFLSSFRSESISGRTGEAIIIIWTKESGKAESSLEKATNLLSGLFSLSGGDEGTNRATDKMASYLERMQSDRWLDRLTDRAYDRTATEQPADPSEVTNRWNATTDKVASFSSVKATEVTERTHKETWLNSKDDEATKQINKGGASIQRHRQ
jgi:hypothetical protein